MIQMPTQTTTKANSVPMEVRSPAMEPGMKAAKAPTKSEQEHVGLVGRAELGVQVGEEAGSRPSFDMEKKTRLWPSSMTRMTLEKPARMATVTMVPSHP